MFDDLGFRPGLAVVMVPVRAGWSGCAAPPPPGARLFNSLSPHVLAGLLRDWPHALARGGTFAVFGAWALAQIASRQASVRRQLQVGLTDLVFCLALVMWPV